MRIAYEQKSLDGGHDSIGQWAMNSEHRGYISGIEMQYRQKSKLKKIFLLLSLTIDMASVSQSKTKSKKTKQKQNKKTISCNL